ncbi:hypothetical protein N9X39_00720 [Alphaproteobacteria bacterium]|jgi:hypothetical protein|nr:hypothetical protein [Alphaproteobacteria bacterium]
MFAIIKRFVLVGCFLISTACTINTEKVILNSNQVEDILPTNSSPKTDFKTLKTTTGIETSYVLNVRELNTQQRIEIYQWFQKNESSPALSVVQDNDFLRVRFEQLVYQEDFLLMVRQAGSLDESTYQIMFDGDRVFVKKYL